jgi:hypothetical protein
MRNSNNLPPFLIGAEPLSAQQNKWAIEAFNLIKPMPERRTPCAEKIAFAIFDVEWTKRIECDIPPNKPVPQHRKRLARSPAERQEADLDTARKLRRAANTLTEQFLHLQLLTYGPDGVFPAEDLKDCVAKVVSAAKNRADFW